MNAKETILLYLKIMRDGADNNELFDSLIAATENAIFDHEDLIYELCMKCDIEIIRSLLTEENKEKSKLLVEKIKQMIK